MKFGHDSVEDITHRDTGDTVVPFVSYVNSLRSDKPDHCQGPRGSVRDPEMAWAPSLNTFFPHKNVNFERASRAYD